MSRTGFGRYVEAAAWSLASRSYRADHPSARPDGTPDHAARSRPSFRGMALAFLVLSEAVKKNDAAPGTDSATEAVHVVRAGLRAVPCPGGPVWRAGECRCGAGAMFT
jgi:hypothetical protein